MERRRVAYGSVALLLAASFVIVILLPKKVPVIEVRDGPKIAVKTGEEIIVPGDMVVGISSRHVVLLKKGTRAVINADEALTRINLSHGSALSSVETGSRYEVATGTAVTGVRGTIFYVEAEGDTTYVCICRGALRIDAKEGGLPLESQNHKAVYVAADGIFSEAPMIHHTDTDVKHMESFR